MIFRRIIIAIKKVNTDNQPVKILSNFLGFGLIGFSIYILISLISYNAADSAYFYQTNDPNVMNLGGPLGAVVSDILLINYRAWFLSFAFIYFFVVTRVTCSKNI